MNFLRLAEFPVSADLRALSKALDEQDIAHQLIVENRVAVLYVSDTASVERVTELIKATIGDTKQPGFGAQAQRTPVMIALLVLSVVGAIIPEWRFDLLHWLTFQDFLLASSSEVVFATLDDTLASGQYWRLVTPIFIHFGIFHIAFNGLWLWEFGRRIENLTSGIHFLAIVVVAGLVSNVAQYYWSGPSLFGGMSGVIYALLGYIWIRNKLAPHPILFLPPGIVGFMLAWLLICMTGFIDLFFQGSVANAAHASGLLMGMVLGLLFGLMGRTTGAGRV